MLNSGNLREDILLWTFFTSESKLGYEWNFNEEKHFCESFKTTSNPHRDCGSFVVVVVDNWRKMS
jgi:hypothetical protein